MLSRARGHADQAHARKNFLFGQWLEKEAERRGLSTLAARPWRSLASRLLAASGLTSGAGLRAPR